jgi:ATP-dependent Clp protease ATP-binding subunit ClpC
LNLNIGGSAGTPVLDSFSRDLTVLAREKKLDPVIGRDREISRAIQILCRRTKNNPVLLGKSGVGKTAIVEGLAQAIVDKKVPEILQSKRVLQLDLPGILAGTKYRGEFEERLKRITQEMINSGRTIILFIDEIHSLAEAGGASGAIDADDILKPPLARGDLQLVGATTTEEYNQYIKKDVTLDRRLQPIIVLEPSESETLEILRGIKERYERHHGVEISDEALKKAVELSGFLFPDKAYPDKAIDLMDEGASKVKLSKVLSGHTGQSIVVTEKDIEDVGMAIKSFNA